METQAAITAIQTGLNSGVATAAEQAQLWDALAYDQCTGGSITETEITLTAVQEAEEEYRDGLYEENDYWDNFCDMWWCP